MIPLLKGNIDYAQNQKTFSTINSIYLKSAYYRFENSTRSRIIQQDASLKLQLTGDSQKLNSNYLICDSDLSNRNKELISSRAQTTKNIGSMDQCSYDLKSSYANIEGVKGEQQLNCILPVKINDIDQNGNDDCEVEFSDDEKTGLQEKMQARQVTNNQFMWFKL